MAWEDRRVKRAREAAAQPRIGPNNSKNTTERLAALDIGTHAAKLLVVEARRDASGLELRPLLRAGMVTRLGAEVGGGRRPISGAAEARAQGAIAELVDRARALSARTWVAAGTGVLRRAPNGGAVARRLGAALGIELPVLRAETEAALSILGARAGAGSMPPPLLGVDLGGGSTELIFLGVDSERGLAFGVRSLELGCLQLAERYLSTGGEWSGRRGVATLRQALARALPGPILRASSGSPPSWLAIGGTATALATMDLGLTEHDPERVHGHRLTDAAIARLAAGLISELEAPGEPEADGTRPFHRQPGPVLLAGALLLEHLMTKHSVREVVTSTFGLRHGLVLGELGSRGRSRASRDWGDPRHSARLAIELARQPLPPIRSGRWWTWKPKGAKRVDPSVHPQ